MTIVSFPNKVKYKGVFIDPHTPFEIDDADKAELMAMGAHLLQYQPHKVEEVEEVIEEGDSGAAEPVPDDGEEESLDDEEDLPDLEVPSTKPTRRNTKK